MKVIVSAVGLTREDYIRSDCDSALASLRRRWKNDCMMALAVQREAAQNASDEPAAAAAQVVLAVMSMREPWREGPVPAEDDPVLAIYDFDESAYAYLALLLGLIPEAESVIADDDLRGRAADILYRHSIEVGGKRNFHAAKLAAESYLAAAPQQASEDDCWYEAQHRIGRALGIAAELNNDSLRTEAVNHIVAILRTYESQLTQLIEKARIQAEAPPRYPLQLMKLLLQYFKAGDSTEYPMLAQELAQVALTAKYWDLAREYLEVAARWYEKAGDFRAEVAMLERAAELWVEEGAKMIAPADASDYQYAVAEYRLLRGIQALRRVQGTAKDRGLLNDVPRLNERIYEVRWTHQQYQERAVKAVVPISASDTIDVERILATVEGQDKVEALFTMAAFQVQPRTEVEKMVQEAASFPLFEHFGLKYMNERGRTTARTEGGDLKAHTCHRAVAFYEIGAQCYVHPLLLKVGTDHIIDLADFVFIAQASPFVPPGRKMLFARGLYEGMKGNFALAIHLLIPQVENAIRVIVQLLAAKDPQRADYAEVLNDPERPFLTQSLYEPWSNELALLFGDKGEDIVFALRVLLVERFGGNLRNCVMHGLIPYNGAQSWSCCYLWWLILKICCITASAAAHPDLETGEAGYG